MTEPLWHRHDLPASERSTLEIVWLHGWGQSGESLLPLARLFAARGENVVFDLPGFGRTPGFGRDVGSADYADSLAARLAAGRRRVLVGHSFGARVALQTAIRHPETAAGLVFIAGAGLPTRRRLAWRLRAALLKGAGRMAGAVDDLAGTHLKDAYRRRFGSADYRSAGALRGTLVRVVNEDLSGEARRLEVPVLLIYGSEDTETPPALGRRYRELIGDAELHVIEGFGHMDILSRGAYQCENLIERFVERLDP